MKEIYFTGENLEVQSRDLYQQAVEISRQKVLELQPLKSALLVLDMQSYFLDASSHAYVPSLQAIVNGIRQLIKAYSDHQLPIFFSQHINTPENAGMMSVWWKDLITPDHPHHCIIPEIDPSVGTIIKKNQYDAFHQTPMQEMLQTGGVTQVVICGVMTHLCCETTARSAFMRGFEVFFLVDGTATYNLAYHRASLINLSHGFASLVFVKDILAAIHGEHERG
jgi:bifunctional isochorismate lyase/aryl carrier protein